VADIPAAEHFAGGDTNKLYYLVTQAAGSATSTNSSPLLLVLPGGDGARDFQPFIKRLCKNALPNGYLVAQLIAPPMGRKPIRESGLAHGKIRLPGDEVFQ